MKKIVYIVIFILAETVVDSQQLPVFSQYTDNLFLVNPAVAGAEGVTTITLTNRIQWVGISGAPQTSALSIEGRILKRRFQLKSLFGFLLGEKKGTKDKYYVAKKEGKVGMGGYVFEDRNGVIDRTGFLYAYTYHIFLRGYNQISFGLALSAFQFRLDRNNIVVVQPDDPILNSSVLRTSFIPDASVGFYWMNHHFFAGLSGLQLSQSFLKYGNSSFNDYQLLRTYYAVGGGFFPIGNDYTINPTVLLKTTEQAQTFQTDFTAKIMYEDQYWTGMSYRTNGDIVFLMGVKYGKFIFNYSYDYPPNPLRQHTYGSHELTIAMKFGSTERRYRWKDRF